MEMATNFLYKVAVCLLTFQFLLRSKREPFILSAAVTMRDFWEIFIFSLLSVLCCDAIPILKNKELIEYKKLLDQDASASSYYFRKDNNGPMQVVYLRSEVPSSLRRSQYELAQPHPQPYHHHHHQHLYKKQPLTYYRTHGGGAISSYAPAYAKTHYNHHQHPQHIYSSKIKYIPGIVEDVSQQYHDQEHDEEDNSGNASSSSSSQQYDDHRDRRHRKPKSASDSSSSSSSSESKSHEGGLSSGKSAHSDKGSHEDKGGKEHKEAYDKKNGKKSTTSYEKSYKYSKGSKGKYDKKDKKGKKDEEGKHDVS